MVEWLALNGTWFGTTVAIIGAALSGYSLRGLQVAWSKPQRHTLADLGPLLKKERTRRGITQKQAAGECGVKAFGEHERGREVHSIEDLGKLANFVGKEGRDFL